MRMFVLKRLKIFIAMDAAKNVALLEDEQKQSFDCNLQ